MSTPICLIDEDVLNVDTLRDIRDIGQSFFASACGKNRGAFVLTPPDGHTYGCLYLPPNLQELAGGGVANVTIESANDIKNQYVAGNITSEDALAMLDFIVQAVYNSTANKDSTPYACEVGGLAKLSCPDVVTPSPRADGTPIRAVGLSGLFVDALWATGGQPLTLDEAKSWYTEEDFEKMKQVGLNTVQIAIPTSTFRSDDTFGSQVKLILDDILEKIEAADLDVILSLVSTGDELDEVVAASKFCEENSGILGIALPKGMMIDTMTVISSIRAQAPSVPIFLPMNEGDLVKFNGEFDSNVYGALELSHTATVADVASSTSVEDRSKLFYHEATACIVRSPLEFASCFRNLPIFMASGFDLSIDDCINKGIDGSFKDYGQCDRFNETIGSAWWQRHRSSFAARQVYAYEQGLGWSFATWKLYGNENVGVIDSPEKLLSLEDIIAADLFPNLNGPEPIAATACLNPPVTDFVLGDKTLAPTMSPPPPPPDCGNGWWNYTSEQCDYWIPPPPPTPAPTRECPVCDECKNNKMSRPLLKEGGALIAGALVGAVVTAIGFKIFGKSKRSEYTTIPN